MKYLFDGISMQNGRQTNMDSLLLKSRRIGNRSALLGVVCDGVGSFTEGAFASGVAVKVLNKWFDKMAFTDSIGLKMRNVILEINTQITTEARQKNIQTASTLSAILLIEDAYYIVHIGDSRIYSYADETLICMTDDDTNELGKLIACIGRTEDIVPHYLEGNIAGKTFVICSDGLHKRMDQAFMIAQMKRVNKRSLKSLVTILAQYVIERGEQDNISLGIIKVED